jgi:hypothetical protein
MKKRDERIALDAYVVDALMPDLVGHDRRASAFVVYLYLWRRTKGGARGAVVSHQQVADGTGLSKRGAQLAMGVLERRRLVELARRTATAAPTVRLVCEWRG